MEKVLNKINILNNSNEKSDPNRSALCVEVCFKMTTENPFP